MSRSMAIGTTLLVLAALLLAFLAWYRADDNVSPRTVVPGEQETVQESAAQIATRIGLESRLLALRARLAAQEGYQDAAEDIGHLRTDLAEAYRATNGDVRKDLEALDGELQALERTVRDESADALLALEALIARVRSDILTDQ